MAVIEMGTGGVRIGSLKFEGKGDRPVSYQGLIALEWLPEQQDSTYEAKGPGKLKYWRDKADGSGRESCTEPFSVGPNGEQIPNDKVMCQPILVWAPGPNGTGLVDPEIREDIGVRKLILPAGRPITRAFINRMNQAGRLQFDAESGKFRGQLWPGDVINIGWHAKDGNALIWDGPQTSIQIGTPQTQEIAARVYDAHTKWLERRKAEKALELGNGNTGAQPPAPSLAHQPGMANGVTPAPGYGQAPAAAQYGMTPAGPAVPATPAVDPGYQAYLDQQAAAKAAAAAPPAAPAAAPVDPAYQAWLDQQAAAAAPPAAPAAPPVDPAYQAWLDQQAAAKAAAAAPAPVVDPELEGMPPGANEEEYRAYRRFQIAQQQAAAAPPATGRPNFAPPVGAPPQ